MQAMLTINTRDTNLSQKILVLEDQKSKKQFRGVLHLSADSKSIKSINWVRAPKCLATCQGLELLIWDLNIHVQEHGEVWERQTAPSQPDPKRKTEREPRIPSKPTSPKLGNTPGTTADVEEGSIELTSDKQAEFSIFSLSSLTAKGNTTDKSSPRAIGTKL